MKGERTRQHILEAMLECLVDWGYAHTTHEHIALRAGLSRGAVTHHFPTRLALYEAFAEYLTAVRLAEYTRMVEAVVAGMRGRSDAEAMRLTLDRMDEDYARSPGFLALQALLIEARGDRQLKRLLATLARDIDARETRVRAELLPVWKDLPETSEVLRDLTVYALISLTVSPEACGDPARRSRLLDVIASAAAREMTRALAEKARSAGGEEANCSGSNR